MNFRKRDENRKRAGYLKPSYADLCDHADKLASLCIEIEKVMDNLECLGGVSVQLMPHVPPGECLHPRITTVHDVMLPYDPNDPDGSKNADQQVPA
tara:strand:+ start:13191 stop:13478 length:288 start_codon:yes stop_codon:yes gene_type:complete